VNRIVLITGLAGAGRTTASDAMEDMGFYVMENLPSLMIKSIVDGIKEAREDEISLAIAVDLRDSKSISTLFETRTLLREEGYSVHIVFLDADEDTIVRRFEQTRRPHPYISSGALTKAIETERQLLSDVLAESDVHIDTTVTNPTQLGQQLGTLFSEGNSGTTIVVNSFGFKYGAPRDADFIFDVRFLPNPFWEPELKEATGLEPQIQEYVRKFENYDSYLESIKNILSISIDEFSKLGKGFVTIAFGCTGGYHRSVTVAQDIANWFGEGEQKVILVHRELENKKSK
jgi:UPF0042 nucleotide-binding protein